MEEEVEAALLLDRFVSASSSDDIANSLQEILQSVRNGSLTSNDLLRENDEFLDGLRTVFHEGKYKSMNIENGSATACRIYLTAINKSSREIVEDLLDDEKLLIAAIDVASDTNLPSYPRVSSIQLLHAFAEKAGKTTQAQLLAAPNGLHRLGDLLNVNVDEQVRNEALLLASKISEWASVSKVWMFSEVGDVVIQTAISEGGLTSGNVLVLDCLRLLKNMVQHDAALAELVFQSPVLVPNLTRLLDLRFGYNFIHPPDANADLQNNNNLDDDLDDLLASGGNSDKADKSKEKQQKKIPVPKLLDSEEKIIHAVFDILSTVLENESVKKTLWNQHTGLAFLIYEMALLTAQHDQDYFCAMPSISLQQRALHMTAKYLDSMDIMNKHSGLDRLLYLVCTSGGRGTTITDKMKLSLSALHVIRCTLDDVTVNEMLMHTLAPPMTEDGDENNINAQQQSQQPTEIQKLLNTAYENLRAESSIQRQVFLAGSLNALTLFLTDEPRRAVFFKLTNSNDTGSLLEALLECLDREQDDEFILMVILRFLGHWMIDAPIIVHSILQSPHATVLSVLYGSSKSQAASAMAGALLGLCMEYMSDESQCGGFTRSGLLELVQTKRGISFYTSQLEKLKSLHDLPWHYCEMEWNVWKIWYSQIVLLVRKRVVQELTSAGGSTDDEEDGVEDDAGGVVNSKELKSMQQLVTEQSSEIEELRAQLSQAQRTISSQEKQLDTWKQRVESNPTQLDEMLNQYIAKNSQLEEKVLSLEEEIRSKDEKHLAELTEKDTAIASIQKDLDESRNQESETQQELESLREDMTALSEAYSSLEEEYRKQQEAKQAVPETPAGEEQGSEQQQQPEGEGSQQAPVGSTEVATLRAENARMRIDAEKADEWMTMAVERMNTMEAENSASKQEAAALKDQLDQALAATQASDDETTKMLSEETQQRMRLQEDLTLTSQQLADERVRYEQLYSQMEPTTKALEELQVEREKLISDISSLTEQLEASSAHQMGYHSEAESLRESNGRLEQEIAMVRNELDSTLRREQEEISKRDSLIEELQSSTSGVAASDDAIRSRDEEIQQLKDANDAAQDWMSKAVEHHQMLSDQVSSLSQQNAELQARLEEVTSSAESSNALMERLQMEINEKTTEIEDLKSSLSDLQNESNQADSSLDRISDLEHELDQKKAGYDAVRADAKVKNHEIKLLQGEIAERDKTIKALTDELEEVKETNKMLEQKVADLEQKVADLEATRIEVGTTEEEISLLRARAAEAEARNTSIENILEAVAKEKQELTHEAKKNRETLEKIETELNELRNGSLDTTQRSDYGENLSQLEEKIEVLESRLRDQNEEARSVIQQWEESYHELHSQKSDLEKQIQSALAEKEAMSDQINGLQSEIENLKTQMNSVSTDDLNSRISELETLVSNLQEQLADQEQEANNIVAQWQESYNELEAQNRENEIERSNLESQLAQIKSESVNGPSSPTNIEEVENLQLEIKNLQERLASQEAEATSAVSNLQKSCGDLEERLNSITNERDDLLAQMNNKAGEGNKVQPALETDESESNRVVELETEIKRLKEEFSAQEEEAQNVVLQWQESYNEISAELESIRAQLDATEQKPKSETQGSDDVNGLQAQIQSLEGELEEAQNVVMQWQESYNEVVTQLENAQLQLDATDKEKTSISKSGVEGTDDVDDRDAQIQSLEGQLEEAKNVVLQWQESYNEISAELESMKAQLDATEQKPKSETEESGDVEGLQAQIQSLEGELKEAQNVVLQWQESYSDVVTQLENAKLQLGTVEKEKETSRSEGEGTDDGDDRDAQIQSLEQQLEEAQNVVLQWEESYNDISAELDNVKLQLETAEQENEKLKSGTQGTGDTETLETQIQTLEGQLEEAQNVVMQWQESYNDVSTELENMKQQLEAAEQENEKLKSGAQAAGDTETLEAQIQTLEGQLEEAQNVVMQWQESYNDLSTELENAKLQLETAEQENGKVKSSAQGTGDTESLEAQIQTLEGQLEEAQNVVMQWQESYNDISAELENVKQQLETAEQENEKLKSGAQRTGDTESLEAQIQTLEGQLEEAQNVVMQWQESYNDLSTELENVKLQLEAAEQENEKIRSGTVGISDIGNLEAQIQTLEEDLRNEQERSQTTISHYEIKVANLEKQLELEKDNFHASKVGVEGGSRAEEAQIERISDLEEQVQKLEKDLLDRENEAKDIVSQWQDSYEAICQERDSLLDQLQDTKNSAEQSSDKAIMENMPNEQYDTRVAELESIIKDLERQLEQNKKEGESIVQQWQESYDELKSQLDAALTEKETDTVVADQKQIRINELEETVKELENQVNEEEQQATEVVSQWQQSYEELDERLRAVEHERDNLLKDISEISRKQVNQESVSSKGEDAVDMQHEENNSFEETETTLASVRAQLLSKEAELLEAQKMLDMIKKQSSGAEVNGTENDRNNQLESEIDELRRQLSSQEEDAMNVVSQWQESHGIISTQLEAAISENESLSIELEKYKRELESINKQNDVKQGDDGEEDSFERIEELTLLLDTANNNIQILEKQVENLRNDVASKQSQIEELQNELSRVPDATRQMKTHALGLEKSIEQHLETIHSLRCDLEREKKEKADLETKVLEAEERLSSQIEFSTTDIERMKGSAETDRLMDREKIEHLENENDKIRQELSMSTQERDRLRSKIAELDDELREANDTLQFQLTNEISDKAADAAAALLREQIEELRMQARETHKILSEQRKAREDAEAEVDRLRSDLAALLGMEDNEDTRSSIRQRVLEATENFRRSERHEIEQLRQSLTKALEELSSSRQAEKEVEERAAKANHQAILYEQEVINAKNDFKFLSQTMDEMRESESLKRASLEYRISSLESEQDVLKRMHSAEIENLRNECSQVNMERERLFQALKESEKSKENLMKASSKDLVVDGNLDPHTELARLRVEKAQLLSLSAEEASRVERRIRENRAVAKAAAEADVIMEREMRIAAEKSLEKFKLEVETMKSHSQNGYDNELSELKRVNERLQAELVSLQKENKTLLEKNELLSEKLKSMEKESNVTIDRLKEECRQAKARVNLLERNGHFEAEVRAEVARLQAVQKTDHGGIVVANNNINPANDDDDDEKSAQVVKLYEIIQRQKNEIKEERTLYCNLVSEHDDLLALFAQQNLLKDTFKTALQKSCGQEAVNIAINQAEQKVHEQFGKYVQLS